LNKSLPSLLLFSVFLLFGCGGGGSGNVQDTSNPESNFFSNLDQGLPYFMDANDQDLLTLSANLFIITVPISLGTGAEENNCSKSGSFDRNESSNLIGTTQISDTQDIYNNCISNTGVYQNGIITIHAVNDGASLNLDVQSENFVNTNYRSGDSDPIRSKLKNIKIAESGTAHVLTSETTRTTIDKLVYTTENGEMLTIDNYIHELYIPSSQNTISHVLKKSNYSANWVMKHDASHHKLISTSPIPAVGDTYTLRATPEGLNYKLDVEITKELVYLKSSTTNAPTSGSYKITLTNSNNTNNANGFNASTIILDTVFKNNKATISRYICEVAVLPNSCEEVNFPPQVWEINL